MAHSLESIYRSLDHFDRLNLELQTWLYEAVKEQYGRDPSHAYYDVTNYYFEIDIERTREDFGLGRLIIVADKGLNCGDNIARQLAIGNGYIYSQSIRGTDQEFPSSRQNEIKLFTSRQRTLDFSILHHSSKKKERGI